MTHPSFWTLSSDAQTAIIDQMADFVTTDLPALKACGRFIPTDRMPIYHRGIDLLSHFPSMRTFCADATSARTSFDQFVNRMSSLFDLIKLELAKDVPVRSANGESVVVLSPSRVRRGRPTTAEAENLRIEREELRRSTSIARMLGARVVTLDKAPILDPKAESKDKEKHRPTDEPDLFSAASSTPASPQAAAPAAATTVSTTPISPIHPIDPSILNSQLKSLREWSWCLPSPLPQRIEALRDTRADIAAQSELAKQLLESGAPEREVAIHTRHAKQLNEQVRDLYAEVDEYLCCYYIILTELNKEYGKLAEIYAAHGGYDVLVNDLRPYFEKFSSADVARLRTKAQKMANDYELGYIEPAERAKQLKNIENYMRRKDVKPSAARLKKMREYYEKVKMMGCGEDTLAGYEVFIKAMEDALAQQSSTAPSPQAAAPAAAPSEKRSQR